MSKLNAVNTEVACRMLSQGRAVELKHGRICMLACVGGALGVRRVNRERRVLLQNFRVLV